MSTRADVAELKDSLGEYLAQVAAGQEVVVCKSNVPFAKIVPLPKPKGNNRYVPGLMSGSATITGDIVGPCIPEEDWGMHK